MFDLPAEFRLVEIGDRLAGTDEAQKFLMIYAVRILDASGLIGDADELYFIAILANEDLDLLGGTFIARPTGELDRE